MKHASRLLGICLFFLSGCSSKPDDQMGLAQKAQEQAKEQHAAEFASSEWRSAEQAWDQAKQRYDNQKYREAGSLFLTAKSRFERARNVAKSKRDPLLRELQNMQKTIDLRYQSLKTNLAANEPNLSSDRKKRFEESCKDIDKGIERLKTELEQGDYTAAQGTAQTTVRQVYDSEKELERVASGKRKTP